MSCCGEPSHKADTVQAAQYVTPFQTQPVTQQPGPQPNLQWQQPSINEKGFQSQPGAGPSPPPQAYGGWEKSSPNQQTTFQPYVPQGSPPPVAYPIGAMPPQLAGSPPGSTTSPFSPYGAPAPVQTPPLARTPEQRSVPMTVTTRGSSPPSMPQQLSFAADEGKLSVSIDFGAWILRLFPLEEGGES